MARRRARAAASSVGTRAAAHAKASKVQVDPRLSARREQVARSRRRRWWLGLGLLGAIFLLAAGSWLLLHTSLFSAKTLRVEGSVPESTSVIVAASGVTRHTPLISIDPAAAATGIEALPWVKSADVALHWPSTVVITVTKRTPVALMHAPSRHALIDATGRVVARPHVVPAGAPTVHLVVPGVVPGIPGTWLPTRAAPAVKVAATLPPAFRGQVKAVVGHLDGTVTLQMNVPVSFVLGMPNHLLAKYKDVAAIIAGTTLRAGDVIDVSVPQASTISGP